MDIFAFDLDLISVSCVAPMGPVSNFTMRTLLVLVFFCMACLIHFIFIATQRQKGLQLSVLGSTVGTLFMVFFISVCSSLLAPFRCFLHPNGESTVQAYHSVRCDGQDEHLQMSLIGGALKALKRTLSFCERPLLHVAPWLPQRVLLHYLGAVTSLVGQWRGPPLGKFYRLEMS